MNRVRPCAALAIALTLQGCGKQPRSDAVDSSSAPPPPSRAPRLLVSAELSSPSAFDLIADAEGLRLIWASASPRGNWLHEQRLLADGQPHGPPRDITLPARTLGKLTDLDATLVAGRLALAWLEQGAKEARAAATLIEPGTPPGSFDLGPAALVAEAARGNIAIAAEPERSRALVMWRGLEAECVAPSSAPCASFTFKRLGANAIEPTGLPLAVPVPCASHSVALATSPGRFYYGVCTRQGSEPLTTMFSIQYDPEYARAESLLKGCLPLGTVQVDERPWLVGDCHGRRSVVPIPVNDEKVVAESIDRLAISCTRQQLELRQGRFLLALREPRADLQTILPESLVPTGARAGWTGGALFVVHPSNSQLEVRSLTCRAGKLAP